MSVLSREKAEPMPEPVMEPGQPTLARTPGPAYLLNYIGDGPGRFFNEPPGSLVQLSVEKVVCPGRAAPPEVTGYRATGQTEPALSEFQVQMIQIPTAIGERQKRLKLFLDLGVRLSASLQRGEHITSAATGYVQIPPFVRVQTRRRGDG